MREKEEAQFRREMLGLYGRAVSLSKERQKVQTFSLPRWIECSKHAACIAQVVAQRLLKEPSFATSARRRCRRSVLRAGVKIVQGPSSATNVLPP